MRLTITEDQYKIIKSKLEYKTIIEEMVFRLSIINENDGKEPDIEWDFTDVKNDLDNSKKWVKTKDDVKEYITNLKDKIKKLPNDVKKRIMKYVLYSFLGIITIGQINNMIEPLGQELVKKEKALLRPDDNQNEYIKIRSSSKDLYDHLKYEEGSIVNKGEPVLKAYNLGDGAYTIGYGHAVFKGENEGYDFLPSYEKIIPKKTSITKKQAEILLKDDIKEAEGIVNKILDDWEKQDIKPKITQGMYDAMVSMSFNMGRGIRKTDFIQAVKKGDMELARELILQTSSHMFKKYPGLKIRRENEYKMFV
jgi:GH24 family phage-related lysozyme (muramidase)